MWKYSLAEAINMMQSKAEPIVKSINPQETLLLRQIVLRNGKPFKDCMFAGDDLVSTTHFGIYKNNLLAGVATYFENSNTHFQGDQLQLRGMAVLDEYRGTGFGKLLLKRGEELAWKKKKNIIWFNARLIAVPFYENSGYRIYGESFLIEEIGIHFVMFKEIN